MFIHLRKRDYIIMGCFNCSYNYRANKIGYNWRYTSSQLNLQQCSVMSEGKPKVCVVAIVCFMSICNSVHTITM